MRESWTDDRMDDLNAKVDELGRRMDNGFNRVEANQQALRGEMQAELGTLRKETQAEFGNLRGEMNERFNAIDGRFDAIDGRFDAMYRTMIWFCGLVTVALLGMLTTLLGAVV